MMPLLTCWITSGEQKLKKLLGEDAKDAKDLKRSANFYRHAREARPPRLFTLGEAKPILKKVVRAVVAKASESASGAKH